MNFFFIFILFNLINACDNNNIVSCLIGVTDSIADFYVNEQNITSLLKVYKSNHVSTIYTIQFTEPEVTGKLAFSVYCPNEIVPGQFFVNCTSTNINSNWNMLSVVDYSWTTVIHDPNAHSYHSYNLPHFWYYNNYTGPQYNVSVSKTLYYPIKPQGTSCDIYKAGSSYNDYSGVMKTVVVNNYYNYNKNNNEDNHKNDNKDNHKNDNEDD